MRRNTARIVVGRAAGQLARGQLLVPDRRAAHVAQLRPGRGPRGTARAARARPDDDQVVLLLAGLHAGAGRDRRGDGRAVRRLPRPACRTADEHGPHVHRRAHVGAELGPALAGGPGPVQRRLDGRAAGLVRRARWCAGSARTSAVAGWLVSNEMPLYGGDQAPHEVVAAWAQIIRDAVRAAGGRQPFSLGDGAWGIEATGRENGFRLADAAAICDFLGPHIYPVGDDQIRQHYAAAWQCELASTFGKPVVLEEFGVSSDFASRGERGPLLPARPAQQPAGRSDRLDRLEQHRLRPARPGPVPAPRLRAALRPHRRGRPAQGHPARDAGVRGHARRNRGDPVRADRHRRRPDRPVLPGHQLPVHRPGRPRAHRADAGPGLRLGPAGRPAGGADQGNQRHRPGRPAVPGALGETAARARPAPSWSGSRPTVPASTCPTRQATPHGTGGRRTGG